MDFHVSRPFSPGHIAGCRQLNHPAAVPTGLTSKRPRKRAKQSGMLHKGEVEVQDEGRDALISLIKTESN
jgi:hypothetical protein